MDRRSFEELKKAGAFDAPFYVAGEISGIVFLCDNREDADALIKIGYNAVCGFAPEYAEQFKGIKVYILTGDEIAAKSLYGVADEVWMTERDTDIAGVFLRQGVEDATKGVNDLANKAVKWTPPPDPFLSCFKTLEDFEEEEAAWLIPGWIPVGQITTVAADGGIGKTTWWCELLAALSSGRRCILDPEDLTRQAQTVAFMTTEDSVRKKLKKKLREAGANMSNIITPDFLRDTQGLLRRLKFGTKEMERFVRYFKPALCVFDPIQGFVPPDINMGSRNAMRDCMAPLISLGEETGTTFLVICHTNKRKGAFGRDRIADSADLWDVSRSVIMAGFTEDQGVRYLSNEKNNYAELQDTVLFSIDDHGRVLHEGTTWKRDREFIQDAILNTSAPKRNDCKEWILHELEVAGGPVLTKRLEDDAKASGYSYETLRRAKRELKTESKIDYYSTGSAKKGDRVYYIQLLEEPSSDLPREWME